MAKFSDAAQDDSCLCGPMLRIGAHEQNVIHFTLRVPDSSQTTRRKSRGGSEVPVRFQVTCILWICPRPDRAKGDIVPLNVLENSLTLRSVALHHAIVAS